MAQETRWFEDQTTEEAKAERGFLRNALTIFGAACFLALLLIAAALATKAHAQEIPLHVIEHHNGVKLQLLGGPCMDPTSNVVIASVPPQFQRGWKALSSQWRMQNGEIQEFAGCWLRVNKNEIGTDDDLFIMVFSDGAVVQLLKSDLFQKKNGV